MAVGQVKIVNTWLKWTLRKRRANTKQKLWILGKLYLEDSILFLIIFTYLFHIKFFKTAEVFSKKILIWKA